MEKRERLKSYEEGRIIRHLVTSDPRIVHSPISLPTFEMSPVASLLVYTLTKLFQKSAWPSLPPISAGPGRHLDSGRFACLKGELVFTALISLFQCPPAGQLPPACTCAAMPGFDRDKWNWTFPP